MFKSALTGTVKLTDRNLVPSIMICPPGWHLPVLNKYDHLCNISNWRTFKSERFESCFDVWKAERKPCMSMSSHALLFQVLLLHNLIVWARASAHVQENSQIRCFSLRRGSVTLWADVWGAGQSVVGRGSRGTGEVASMRAGFRMIGRDIGGTPTCSREKGARGCKMSGDWHRWGGGDSGGLIFAGVGIGGVEGGTGDDLSDPAHRKERKVHKFGCRNYELVWQ